MNKLLLLITAPFFAVFEFKTTSQKQKEGFAIVDIKKGETSIVKHSQEEPPSHIAIAGGKIVKPKRPLSNVSTTSNSTENSTSAKSSSRFRCTIS